MRRHKIFLITRRNGRKYYVKALDMSCAVNVLQGLGIPCKTIVPAPGHYREAVCPHEIRWIEYKAKQEARKKAKKERKNG